MLFFVVIILHCRSSRERIAIIIYRVSHNVLWGNNMYLRHPVFYMRNVDHKALGFSFIILYSSEYKLFVCCFCQKSLLFFLCKSMLLKNVRTNRSRGYKIHGRKSLVVYHKLLANGNSEHRLVGEKKGQKIVIKGLFCYMHKAFLEGRDSTAGNIITFSFSLKIKNFQMRGWPKIKHKFT